MTRDRHEKGTNRLASDVMAANLTPQYLEAEAEYKKARTPSERLEWLKKMYSLLPKHKASEKLQAELKTKISDTRKEIESESKSPKKGGVSYKIPKQGAGQYAIVGAPNTGKSLLLTRLTRAAPEVAPYPFTTREPYAGMMDWEDVRVQLIDTPPITADYMEPYLSSTVSHCGAASGGPGQARRPSCGRSGNRQVVPDQDDSLWQI